MMSIKIFLPVPDLLKDKQQLLVKRNDDDSTVTISFLYTCVLLGQLFHIVIVLVHFHAPTARSVRYIRNLNYL